jgi:trigger factor
MQVTETLSDGLRRAYAVVVPACDIEGKVKTKLAEIGRTIKLPGFRPGKVPVNLVRQRYGASVMAEVMQDSLNTAADLVIEERGLRPAGQPRIALAGQPDVKAATASDLAFSVELEILPEIVAPDLGALSLVRLRAEVPPEAIDSTLERLARQQREMIPVEEDRGAETGDVLMVDFLGRVDGVPFEGGAGQDTRVEIGGEGFIPGFSEGMAGMKAGETRIIDVTFPAEYQAEALAGKAAQFEITAKTLSKPAEAAIDDALAGKLGFESLEKLRETVSGQMQRELDQMARLRIKRELLDLLSDKADFPAPQNLVEAEFGAIWQRVEQDMNAGQIDEEDRGKDTETLRAEYRAIADRRVRLGLLLSEIGTKAGIQVSQAELTQALRQEAARYPGQEMQVIEFFRKTPQAIEQLRGPLFEDKVVDYILEMAKVEDRLVSPDELNLPPPDPAEPAKLSFVAAPEALPEAEEPPAEPPADMPATPAGDGAA